MSARISSTREPQQECAQEYDDDDEEEEEEEEEGEEWGEEEGEEEGEESRRKETRWAPAELGGRPPQLRHLALARLPLLRAVRQQLLGRTVTSVTSPFRYCYQDALHS